MNYSPPVRLAGWAALGLAGVGLLAVGCSGKSAAVKPNDARNQISQLAILYGHYSMAHQGRGPANEKEFKDYYREHPDKLPAGTDVSKLDDLFICPRDGQPYGIVYGVTPAPPGPPGPGKPSNVIVFEKVGSGGKHYVAMSMPGMVEEVDDAQLKEMVPNAR